MRDELNQSFDHLRLAVGHAAGGAANLVGPRVGSARRSAKPGLRKANRATAATVVPIARAARDGALRGMREGRAKVTRKEPRVKRWPMMLGGLLIAGAAAGAASAVIARRRANRGRWEEYGTPTTGRNDSIVESAKASTRSAAETGKEKVQSLAESAKERAADLTGTSSGTPEFGSREDVYGKAGTTSRNSR
jgi:hypothetical protein